MNITLNHLSTDTPLRLEDKGVNFPLSSWDLSMICGAISSIQYHPFCVRREEQILDTRVPRKQDFLLETLKHHSLKHIAD